MGKRFVAIWFRYLKTDWYTRRIPAFGEVPLALALPDHGRMVIVAVNAVAEQKGIYPGMAVADARAIFPELQVLDDKPGHAERILNGLAEWCIRYTPWSAVDMPEGLVLDATGCAHLWGGENDYLTDINNRLKAFGYQATMAMADTIGTAWALSRFGTDSGANNTYKVFNSTEKKAHATEHYANAHAQFIIHPGAQMTALLPLPPAALRVEAETIDRLNKLGLRQIRDFISMPRTALRRRFGPQLLMRLDQALGHEEEIMQPVQPVEPYAVRLPCAEPILTRTGIEIALQTLLNNLCQRLKQEGKGVRACLFKGFRTDGKIVSINIGTNRATHNREHLFKLFEIKLDSIEPALGIEFFVLEAGKVEDVTIVQEKLWGQSASLQNTQLSELLDRISGKLGNARIHRYLPDEHYWPERSIKPATSLEEKPATNWQTHKARPLQLLAKPEPVQVTAPHPDYPPMLFIYKGRRYKVANADGPERIEQEWWLQQGEHRDYYVVEDEEGCRYWLFRLGHYGTEKFSGWFIHGFFA
jgi:protein ImuB